MAAAVCSGLLILAALLPSSGGVYVRRGSDITDCSMKCPRRDGAVALYRICNGKETHLLELWCENMSPGNITEPRLLYNTSTGCWTLRDAEKSDSCVYKVVYDRKSLTLLPITVQDPAVSRGHVIGWISSSVVVMTIIIALVMYYRRKRTKTEDVEKCTEKNEGQISSSQTDRPEFQNLLIRIRETWENIRKTPEYEETPQRRARDEGRPLGECDSIAARAHD